MLKKLRSLRKDQWAVLVVGLLLMITVWVWPHPPLPNGVEVEKHPLTLGPNDKPALTIFSWWGCLHCQKMWEQVGPQLVQRAQAGEIRLVYRPVARTKTEGLVSGLLYCQPPAKAFEQIEEYFGFSRLAELALREHDAVKPLLPCVEGRSTQDQLIRDNQAIYHWRVEYTPTLFAAGQRVPPEQMSDLLKGWATP